MSNSRHTFIPTLVHQLDHDVNLIHSSAIEVLAHICRQLLLTHTPLVFSPSHRRRLPPNARVDQKRLIERRCESSRRRQVMRNTVCIEQRQRTCVPRHLYVYQFSIPRIMHGAQCTLRMLPLTPGPSLPPVSALTAANSFSAKLPLSFAAAAAAAFCLLFLACAAAAICLSRTVEASERESSGCTAFFAGGIVV